MDDTVCVNDEATLTLSCFLVSAGLPVSSVLLMSTLLNPGNIPSVPLTNSAAVTIPLIDPNGPALPLTADNWPVPTGVATTNVSVIVGATIGALFGLSIIGTIPRSGS